MKQLLILSTLVFTLFFLISCEKQNKVSSFDFENYNLEAHDYFESELPVHFHGNNLSLRGDETDEMASLGRLLFYDTNLSLNNAISCGTCHKQHLAFADDEPFSKGLFNKSTTRNSSSLTNTGFKRRYFWDASQSNLHRAVVQPIENHIEMGVHNFADIPEKLKNLGVYDNLFKKVFGENAEIDTTTVEKALATFVASMYSYNSKYDQSVENDFVNFSAKEREGRELFIGKANCETCHREPFFKYYGSSNIGLDMVYTDEGRGNGIFNTPNLRNVAFTAPYMHDGRYETLLDVINHYDHGVKDHKHLDQRLKTETGVQNLGLTEYEKECLIAFLGTLSDYAYLTDERFSNPF